MRKMFTIAIIFASTLSVLLFFSSTVQAKNSWHKGTPSALRGFWRHRTYVYEGTPKGHWFFSFMSFYKNHTGLSGWQTDDYGLRKARYRKLGPNFYKLVGYTYYKKNVWYINKLSPTKLLFNGNTFSKWTGRFRINPKTRKPIW